MTSRPGHCVVCESEIEEPGWGWCDQCWQQYSVVSKDVALRLVERFGLSKQTANSVVRLIEPRLFLVGAGTPEGRCIRWVEESRDSELLCGHYIGRGRLAEIRAAIPKRRSEWTGCHHCGGLGMIRGLDILA